MMDTLSQLPASGKILSASISDPDTDWPLGVLVMSAGSPQDKVDNVASEPTQAVYNGVTLTEYSKAGYLTAKPAADVDLKTFISEIDSAAEGEILGIAFSDESFSTSGVFEGIEDLYIELSDRNIAVEPLSDVHSK